MILTVEPVQGGAETTSERRREPDGHTRRPTSVRPAAVLLLFGEYCYERVFTWRLLANRSQVRLIAWA